MVEYSIGALVNSIVACTNEDLVDRTKLIIKYAINTTPPSSINMSSLIAKRVSEREGVTLFLAKCGSEGYLFGGTNGT